MKTYSQLTIHEKINVRGFIEHVTTWKPSFDRCPLIFLSDDMYLYDEEQYNRLRV